MDVPTQDQVMGSLRAIIPAVGTIVSALGLASADKTGTVVASLLTAVGPISIIITVVWSWVSHSQKAQMQAVLAMPGVEKVSVNAQATPVIATMAMDPAVNKIAPAPNQVDAVTAAAKGAK